MNFYHRIGDANSGDLSCQPTFYELDTSTIIPAAGHVTQVNCPSPPDASVACRTVQFDPVALGTYRFKFKIGIGAAGVKIHSGEYVVNVVCNYWVSGGLVSLVGTSPANPLTYEVTIASGTSQTIIIP